MASNKDLLATKPELLNKLWMAFGAVLGIAFSLSIVTQRTPNIFPQLGIQLGIYEKILYVVVDGAVGFGITRQCQPLKRALVGGLIFPLLFITGLWLRGGSLSPAPVIELVSFGILVGILLGTAWLGTLIGAFIMGFGTSVLSLFMRGTIEWPWISTFTLMGAIGGSLVQISFKKTPRRTLRKDRKPNQPPEWLEQKALEEQSEETDHE